MRTQTADQATAHLSISREIFLKLLDAVRSLPQADIDTLIADRNYEELDRLILNHLLNR